MGSHTSLDARDEDVRRVLDSLRFVVRELRESTYVESGAHPLTAAKLFVLDTVARESGLTVNALAARAHTHQSSISAVVSQLVDRGLLTRNRAMDDGRKRVIAITAKGRRVLGAAPRPPQAALIESIESMPPRMRRSLASGLEALVQTALLRKGRPPLFFEESNHPKPRGGRHGSR